MARSLGITIDGLEELGADLEALGRNKLPEAIRRSLRGKGGEALVTEMKQRAPHRSGSLHAGIGIHDGGRGDDVLVGYQGHLSGGHRGGGRYQLGAWIESGTQPHVIEPKRAPALAFNGGTWERVEHPGMRAQRVAAKSIRAAEWEVLADVVDEIDAMVGGTGA